MIDATDFREDPLYLPKDTKVFVIYDADSLDDTIARDEIFDMYERFGYQCNAQKLLSAEIINNSIEELDIDGIMTSRRDLSTIEVRQWYTFINVLRKARILQKHFIVTFTGYTLENDIQISNLNRAATVFAAGRAILVSTTEADRIVKQVLSKKMLTNSVKDYLRRRRQLQVADNESTI
jgi:hypothetical protein